MKFRVIAATLLVPALVLSLGCKAPTPVGKWSGSFNNIPATFEFKEGGTMAVSASVMGQTATLSGTWSTSGDQLTTNLTTANPAMILTLIPANKRQATSTFKIEGDTLTMTSDGKAQPLNRVKE